MTPKVVDNVKIALENEFRGSDNITHINPLSLGMKKIQSQQNKNKKIMLNEDSELEIQLNEITNEQNKMYQGQEMTEEYDLTRGNKFSVIQQISQKMSMKHS